MTDVPSKEPTIVFYVMAEKDRSAALYVGARPATADDVTDALVDKHARAMNLEAGRQRGLTFEDDWDTLTEQERGGWRLVARSALTDLFSA